MPQSMTRGIETRLLYLALGAFVGVVVADAWHVEQLRPKPVFHAYPDDVQDAIREKRERDRVAA